MEDKVNRWTYEFFKKVGNQMMLEFRKGKKGFKKRLFTYFQVK